MRKPKKATSSQSLISAELTPQRSMITGTVMNSRAASSSSPSQKPSKSQERSLRVSERRSALPTPLSAENA